MADGNGNRNNNGTARCPCNPTQVANNQPNLTFRDEYGQERTFHCEHCLTFWKACENKGSGLCRNLACLENNLHHMFIKDDPGNVKWKKLWKIIAHFLTQKDIKQVTSNNCRDQHIFVQNFINVVKWFGCVKRQDGGSCFLLNEVQRLMEKAGAREGKKMISWFAGHMSKAEAEAQLCEQPQGTFLVRFSETRADQGGFSVAVKTNVGVSHYMILGKPEEMGRDEDGGDYDNSFHLYFEAEDRHEEECHPNLVAFIDERCSLDIEDEISCDRICPGLPLNADFTGYR